MILNPLGAVMAFTVITPLILLAYAVEGRKAVQATSLDYVFCGVAAGLLIAAGGEPLIEFNLITILCMQLVKISP